MQLFLVDKKDNQTGHLSASESRHCMRALRHSIGDEINCIDGKGNMYISQIDTYNKEIVSVKLLETFSGWGEHSANVRLVVSPLRLKDRFEWLIEKSVELGVNEIFPILCQRTDKYKSKFKTARLETLILTALKQCKRSSLPTLHPSQAIDSFLNQPHEGSAFVARGDSTDSLQSLSRTIQEAKTLTLLIGPEGDFTDEEMKLATDRGFQPVSLGTNRLRTETAGIYGLSIFKMIQGY